MPPSTPSTALATATVVLTMATAIEKPYAARLATPKASLIVGPMIMDAAPTARNPAPMPARAVTISDA